MNPPQYQVLNQAFQLQNQQFNAWQNALRDQGNILRQTSNNYYSETIHTSTLSDLNRDTSFVWTTPSVIPTTRGNARDIPTSTTQEQPTSGNASQGSPAPPPSEKVHLYTSVCLTICFLVCGCWIALPCTMTAIGFAKNAQTLRSKDRENDAEKRASISSKCITGGIGAAVISGLIFFLIIVPLGAAAYIFFA